VAQIIKVNQRSGRLLFLQIQIPCIKACVRMQLIICTAPCRMDFPRLVMGCNVIIADGLRGTDFREIEINCRTHVKSAKIGTAIADADIIIHQLII